MSWDLVREGLGAGGTQLVGLLEDSSSITALPRYSGGFFLFFFGMLCDSVVLRSLNLLP